MSTAGKTITAAAAGLASVLGVGVALVAAHTSNEPTTAGISTTSFGMTGAIVGVADSDETKCEDGRKIQFLRKRSGADKLLGSEKADVDGNAYYQALDGLPEARYYTKIKAKMLKRSAQHNHKCGGDKSAAPEFGFDPPGP